jgi:hypothetical protein
VRYLPNISMNDLNYCMLMVIEVYLIAVMNLFECIETNWVQMHRIEI